MSAFNRALALVLALLLAAAADAAPLRVMSFNVRLPRAEDGANDWRHRRPVAIAAIRRAAPDVIGTQELFRRQGDDIVAALPHYAWVGVGRRGGRDDEHMGLFYRRDRLALLDFGNFWLSDTPAVPGSISWGNLYPRMVTWGLFERRADRRRFYVLNTHFPYRAEDEAVRVRAAQAVAAHVATLPAGVPAVLTGDFNTTPDGTVHRLLTARLADAWLAAPRRRGPPETFHAFTGTADRRIDWILARGLRPLVARTLTDRGGGPPASDHFPVVVDFAF